MMYIECIVYVWTHAHISLFKKSKKQIKNSIIHLEQFFLNPGGFDSPPWKHLAMFGGGFGSTTEECFWHLVDKWMLLNLMQWSGWPPITKNYHPTSIFNRAVMDWMFWVLLKFVCKNSVSFPGDGIQK